MNYLYLKDQAQTLLDLANQALVIIGDGTVSPAPGAFDEIDPRIREAAAAIYEAAPPI